MLFCFFIEVEPLNYMESDRNCVESVKVGTDEPSVFLQVRCGDRHQLLPDNLERFDRVVCVLGREMISSGRHYWEVRG